MRLIDADKLIPHLNDYALQESPSDVDSQGKQKISTAVYKAIQNCINAAKEQPTAYNPDKVVEQLEKEFKKYYGENWNKAPYLVRAIEIVKGGGVEQKSECEWKLEDSESNLYVTECVNRHLIFEGTPEENGYKYCPYCGRKIKRGGADGN